jgi:hypothetical protein
MNESEQLARVLTVFLPILAMMMLLVAIAASHVRKTPSVLARLRAFAATLDGGGVTSTARALAVEGRRHGRRVALDLRASLGDHEYRVEVPGAADVRLSAAAAQAWAARGVHATEAAAAARHLFGLLGAPELVVKDGWLRVRRTASEYALSPQSLEAAFDALAGLAPLVARAQVKVRVGGVEREVHAWRVGEATLCPFCRDALEGEGEVAECERCRTAHHRACLDEAGGCTVFGCGAAEPRERLSS